MVIKLILNVSSRCDIVAFYTPWFMNRLKDGFVDVRNPFNPKLVNRIFFEDVSLILFCTKNPGPIIKYLKDIKKNIIFHITLTPYKEDIEENVSKKNIIEDIKKISQIVGIDNLYIRYDPIFISDKYTLDYHLAAFNRICDLLNGYVKHFIVSFLDDYKNVRKNKDILKYKNLTESDYKKIGEAFSKKAMSIKGTVQTCFEEKDLVEYGFKKDVCISLELAKRITGENKIKKWNRGCGCAEMVDIGVYNTCSHFCHYCYANFNESLVLKNIQKHDKNSSLLIGNLESDDIIKVRR